MKSLLSSRPVLWFLFSFNLIVTVAAGIALDGAQGIVTCVGMGAVALGAGVALLTGRPKQA